MFARDCCMHLLSLFRSFFLAALECHLPDRGLSLVTLFNSGDTCLSSDAVVYLHDDQWLFSPKLTGWQVIHLEARRSHSHWGTIWSPLYHRKSAWEEVCASSESRANYNQPRVWGRKKETKMRTDRERRVHFILLPLGRLFAFLSRVKCDKWCYSYLLEKTLLSTCLMFESADTLTLKWR